MSDLGYSTHPVPSTAERPSELVHKLARVIQEISYNSGPLGLWLSIAIG